jgi:hypothetical protein
MNESSPSTDTGRARRLVVTVLIGTAAAAVTAGVALNERHPAEAVVERAEASPALAGAAAAAPGQRDPSKRAAPLSESAPSSVGDAPDRAAAHADPSLPAAADALRGVTGSSAEDAPTF